MNEQITPIDQIINSEKLDLIVPGTDKQSAYDAFVKLQEILGISSGNIFPISLKPVDIQKMQQYFAPGSKWVAHGYHWIKRSSGKTLEEALKQELQDDDQEYYLAPNIIIDSMLDKTGIWRPDKHAKGKSKQ